MSDVEQPKQLSEADLAKLKDFAIFSQDAVNYIPLSATPNQACANCIFYHSAADGWNGIEVQHCHIVESWPKTIEPTGWCERYEPEPEPQLQIPIPVVIVDVEIETSDEGKARKGVFGNTLDLIKNILNPAEPAFQVFKTKDGKMWWIARHTGKFVDREKEILADKAHDAYVARAQKGLVEMPELWTWHKEGTRHGQADVIWKSGGFTLALGHIDNNAEGENAFKFYQKNRGKISLSHMFYYPMEAKQNGVYYAYNTREITTLPEGAEAFPYTTFDSFEESKMTLTPDVSKWIEDLGGPDMLKRAQAADSKAADDTKTLEASGVASKGLENFEGSEADIPGDPAGVKALGIVQKDMDTRLKEAETLIKSLEGLPALVESQRKLIVSQGEQIIASQKSEGELLKQINDLQAKLLEYTALQPPASKSGDTLLDQRDKTFLDKVIEASKIADTPSLVDTLVSGQPAVSVNNGGSQ